MPSQLAYMYVFSVFATLCLPLGVCIISIYYPLFTSWCACTCIYTCIYYPLFTSGCVCTCIYTCIYYPLFTSGCVCTCIYTCIYYPLGVCVHVYIHAYTTLWVCVYMYIYMHILPSVYLWVCVYMYIYMYILPSVDTSSASLTLCAQPYMVPWSWHRNTVGISARVQCWASETIFYILHISVLTLCILVM